MTYKDTTNHIPGDCDPWYDDEAVIGRHNSTGPTVYGNIDIEAIFNANA